MFFHMYLSNFSTCIIVFNSESDSYKPSDLMHKWRNMVFEASLLEGHNDMICSVATDGTTAVTGRYYIYSDHVGDRVKKLLHTIQLPYIATVMLKDAHIHRMHAQ